MTAAITSGKYFSSAETVTSDKLHQIVESATFANMGINELASSGAVVNISATAPTNTNNPWWDTTLSLLRIYDGSIWQPINGRVMTNAGSAVVAGDVVIVSSGADNAFAVTSTANSVKTLGVARESIANAATGVIQTSGMVTMNVVAGAYGTGHLFVGSSTTSGKGALYNSASAGNCGHVLINPASITTSALVLLWGNAAQ